MAAIDVIFHSGALNPSIQTPWQGSRPSCVMNEKQKKIQAANRSSNVWILGQVFKLPKLIPSNCITKFVTNCTHKQ